MRNYIDTAPASTALLSLPLLIMIISAPEIVSQTVIAIIIHELGHFLAGYVMGTRSAKLRAEPGGLVIIERGLRSYLNDFLAAAAGPAASFIFALFFSLIARHTDSEYLYSLSGINFALGTFNILPASPLDGGKMLRALLNRYVGIRTAETILCFTSCVTLFFLLIYSLLCAVEFSGFGPLIVSLWLLFCYCKEP